MYEIDAPVAIKVGTTRFPGLVFSEPEYGTVTIPAKPEVPGLYPARPERIQNATWQNVVSLRTTLPDADGKTRTFHQISRERTDNLLFTSPRTTAVIGLDADENGARISLEALVERAVEDYDAHQLAKAAAVEAALMTKGATL